MIHHRYLRCLSFGDIYRGNFIGSLVQHYELDEAIMMKIGRTTLYSARYLCARQKMSYEVYLELLETGGMEDSATINYHHYQSLVVPGRPKW